jgi:ABC-type dipeptide/oligopeptide/nickel transport system permease component
MGVFIVRRLAFGFLAILLALSASFFFFAWKYPPLRGSPLVHAYWVWLRGVPTGRSLTQGLLEPHLPGLIGAAFGRTMLLVALTLVIVLVVAVPVGCISAATRGSVLDYGLRIATYIAWAVPVFVVAILLQEGFGRIPGGWGTGWFPAVGWAGQCPNGQGIDPHNFQCPAAGHGVVHVGEVIYHLILPAVALALGFIGINARYLRNSILEALDAPHVRVARAKGLSERAVLTHHSLRLAFVAVIPVLVTDLGALFGAALAIDYIFQLGGLGTFLINLLALNADALTPVDTYAIQFALLIAAAIMLAASMLGEVILVLLDPRAKFD